MRRLFAVLFFIAVLAAGTLMARPVAAVQDSPAANPDAVQFGDAEKAPAGAPDMNALGQALCEAGKGGDARALFALFEPALFNSQMQMLKEFLQQMAEENGEPVQDPIESAVVEFEAQAKENPLVVCKIENAAAEECSEQTLQLYTELKISPQACGVMTMTSKMKLDENETTEPVTAVQFGGRWFLLPAM